MDAALVSLKHVNASMQNQQILNDINLEIKQGAHLAIIGKSGSGKSVLLSVIAKKQAISSGEIHYDSINSAEHENPAKLSSTPQIALIEARHHFKNFSNTTDFYYQQRYNSSDSEDALTVEEYLSSIEAHNNGHQYWTLEKAIEKLNLVPLYHKKLIKLSNGETKRLRIAAALVHNPTMLLLDQPLTGLDVNSRLYFNLLLQEIADSGITIVMATSVNEIPALFKQTAVLENGSLVEVIPSAEVKTRSFSWATTTSQLNQAEITALLPASDAASFNCIIKMNNVNVKYGETTILSHINWEVKQGDRWALLGANGAGKSTLLSLVYGDNPQAYSNDITLFDRKRGTGESIWDIKRKCGFVSPELYQFFPLDNSCLQVIESGFYDTLGLFRPSDPKRATLAERWMKLFDIDKYKRHLLKNTPASAQRLCLLARALIKTPTLLILDEPCQGMDEQQKLFFKNVVDTICNHSNLTLIYVTHYREEIPESVTKELKLNKGKVVID